MSNYRIFIIAGELSGDRLGADLMRGLIPHGVSFDGIGGPAMQDMGLKSRFDMAELSLMGLVEILPNIPRLLRRIRQTADAIIADPPDAIITIDSPDFCHRVLKRVRKALPNIKTIHYVAPSVWAWRPERAQKMAKFVDHVLALLPFEPPYMHAAGISCDFIGHPVIAEPQATQAEKKAFCQKYNLRENALMVTFLPGSRRSELKYLGQIYHDALKLLIAQYPDLQVLLPVAANIQTQVHRRFDDLADNITFIDPNQDWGQLQVEKRAAYALSTCALATSGTVGVELGAHGCPMVMSFRGGRMTERMVKRLVKIDTASIINLVNETHDIPEYGFEQCTAQNLYDAICLLLNDPNARQVQIDAMDRAMSLLGRGQAGQVDWATNSVLSFLQQSQINKGNQNGA